MNTRSKQNGFSLIELLVVMAIMAALVAVIAPNFLGRADEAKIAATKSSFKQIETALSMYRLDNSRYPTSAQGLEALVTKSTVAPVPRKFRAEGYLPEVPVDPWGTPYVYIAPGKEGRKYDLYSYGADGVAGGEGLDADIYAWGE